MIYAFNPALAESPLAQAGYPAGFQTTLALRDIYRSYMPSLTTAAAAIAQYLADVDITAQVVVYESGDFYRR